MSDPNKAPKFNAITDITRRPSVRFAVGVLALSLLVGCGAEGTSSGGSGSGRVNTDRSGKSAADKLGDIFGGLDDPAAPHSRGGSSGKDSSLPKTRSEPKGQTTDVVECLHANVTKTRKGFDITLDLDHDFSPKKDDEFSATATMDNGDKAHGLSPTHIFEPAAHGRTSVEDVAFTLNGQTSTCKIREGFTQQEVATRITSILPLGPLLPPEANITHRSEVALAA